MKKIKRAIISVSNKKELIPFANKLLQYGTEIYSTGGTLKTLVQAGIDAKSIESYTNFPEILDGRVKTLHPKIHGGILARRETPSHMDSLKEHDILEFDLVCINLYPFEKVIQKNNFSFEEAIENIDIGGPSMIRAAAKNYSDVAVVTDPDQYNSIMERLDANKGALANEFRFELSVQAFQRTALYDSVISDYLRNLQGTKFPQTLTIGLRKSQELRYGENPHQSGAFYSTSVNEELPWKCLHGKELSYNNLLDLDASLRVLHDFDAPICAIFKHTNPCGISAAKTQKESLLRAMKTDPVSFFGGIVAFNEEVSYEAAEILSKEFIEIIVAPGYEQKSFDLLSKKKNIRLVSVPGLKNLNLPSMELKSAAYGLLYQEMDRKKITLEEMKVVTKKIPSQSELEESAFAFQLVKSIKSNAIAFTRDKSSVGIGAGQMSRLDSMKIAIGKVASSDLTLDGTIMASDAFFPFRDAVDEAIKAGAIGLIQPGGSMRDQESIDAADEAGIFMIHTGVRHFKH